MDVCDLYIFFCSFQFYFRWSCFEHVSATNRSNESRYDSHRWHRNWSETTWELLDLSITGNFNVAVIRRMICMNQTSNAVKKGFNLHSLGFAICGHHTLQFCATIHWRIAQMKLYKIFYDQKRYETHRWCPGKNI